MFWWGWAAVGYGWLLTMDLDGALQLPLWLALLGKTTIWLWNSTYWAVVWSVPFWVGLGVIHSSLPSPLGRGILRSKRVRDDSPLPPGEGISSEMGEGIRAHCFFKAIEIRQLVYLLTVLIAMALWWPVLNDRTMNACWLTPGLSTATIHQLQLLLGSLDALSATLATLTIAMLAGLVWQNKSLSTQHFPFWNVLFILLIWAFILWDVDSLTSPFPPTTLPLAIIQGNSPLKTIRTGTASQQAALENHYLTLALQAAADPTVKFILLPEEGALQHALLSTGQTLAGLERWQALVDQSKKPLLLGATVVRGEVQTNELVLLTPHQPPQHQAKGWLVPFGERYPGLKYWQPWFARLFPSEVLAEFAPGPSHPPVMNASGLKLGALNCVEVADEAMARHFRDKGAHVLTVSANLGWFDPRSPLAEQFVAHARWRAMQTGLFVLVAGNTGPSLIIAPNGKVLKALPSDVSGILQIKDGR